MKHFPSVLTAALFVFMVGFFVPAKADRIDQLAEGRVPTALCTEAAGIFDQGIWARNVGIARAIEQSPAGAPTTVASIEDVYKAAMRHPNWDDLTDQERIFFQAHVFNGWDMANDMIVKAEQEAAALPENKDYSITAVIGRTDQSRLTQGYFEKCMEVETAKRTFHKTASSEAIRGGPPVGAEKACEDLKYDLMVIGHAISDGEPKEHLIERARSSRKLSADRMAAAIEMIEEAYAWKKPFTEWMEKRYGACMGV